MNSINWSEKEYAMQKKKNAKKKDQSFFSLIWNQIARNENL